MTNAKPQPEPHAPARRSTKRRVRRKDAPKKGGGGRGWRRRIGWALGLLVLIGAVVVWPQLHAFARTAASDGARMACSCRYVAGRSLDDCRKDFEPGMGLVWLSEDAGARTITARYAIFASQSATWRDGSGCVLEPWKD